MRSIIQTHALLALCASALVSSLTIQQRQNNHNEGAPIIDTGKSVIAASVASSSAAAADSSSAAPSPSATAAIPTTTPTATPAPITHSALPSASVSQVLSSLKAEASTLTTATVAPSQVAQDNPTAAVTPQGGVMTIAIKNNWPSPLSISYLNNADSPSAIGSPGEGPLGTSTIIAYPTGWAGRIYVGSTTHSADTKIEGSTTGANDIDVSLVDGYSVPITCSVLGVPVTGCNIDLWSQPGNCPSPIGTRDVCLNPKVGIADGPADEWFVACQGAAYTFPNDNVANDGDTGRGNVIECCVGTAGQGCAAPERQGKGNNRASKRFVGGGEVVLGGTTDVEEEEGKNETETTVHGGGHGHLARHLLWRQARGHALARGLKDIV